MLPYTDRTSVFSAWYTLTIHLISNCTKSAETDATAKYLELALHRHCTFTQCTTLHNNSAENYLISQDVGTDVGASVKCLASMPSLLNWWFKKGSQSLIGVPFWIHSEMMLLGWVSRCLTSLSTHNRSFRGRSFQAINCTGTDIVKEIIYPKYHHHHHNRHNFNPPVKNTTSEVLEAKRTAR